MGKVSSRVEKSGIVGSVHGSSIAYEKKEPPERSDASRGEVSVRPRREERGERVVIAIAVQRCVEWRFCPGHVGPGVE